MLGKILLVSGPSGSGKSTLIKRLIAEFGTDEIYFSISSTTRDMRDGEKDGVNYHFINKDEFRHGIENDEFLEWALVHGNYYGTSLKAVREALNLGKIVIFDIDVQGFEIVRQKISKNELTTVFVTTPSPTELEKRLLARADTASGDIATRLQNAKDEIKYLAQYDYFVINDELESAYLNFKSIYKTIRLETARCDISAVMKSWK
ncbi:guanylate kinase [Campylobacter sp. VBCF_05 NA6]|uniref:guanylate kinase n=1 Tax=unclassified Campylobacter TaxID=2593542 RepID=UPI0022E9CAA9|nr:MULTISPECIES: guanylate kinase [unclassified Campylobacter]MDA3057076.1 guanylate kinase [Campylobacter sp. VBCF_04 NA7]MDA3059649.1 guanylate kinase [Campylobacter sp. VBCF_05 NA6]